MERQPSGQGPTRLVTFTTLYPSSKQPLHGLFVEHRLRQLLSTREATSKVVAPVPWFPFTASVFGKYAAYARTPHADRRHGIDIVYPRYVVLPKFGMTIAPLLMAKAGKRSLRRLLDSGYDFELIDSHYFFPDGVAAVINGRRLGKPVVVTARGSDVNLIPKFQLARRQILWAARRCAAIITVSQALRDALVSLGVSATRITVLPNGVDLEMFHPMERSKARDVVGLRDSFLLSVGNLIELKGHHIAIEALQHLPDARLVIVGEGEMRSQLEGLASRLKLSDRVHLAGAVPQDNLKYYYSGAEALVLPSRREGMPNVVMESLACGTPVIATPTGGIPEVVSGLPAGVLMRDRDAPSLVQAYRNLVEHYPNRKATRQFAERFSWEPTTRGQLELFRRVSDSRKLQ